MQYPRETIILALLAQAQSAITASFTADTVAGSPALANVSSLAVLAHGIPVFGPGILANAAVDTVTPPNSVTLTDNSTVTGTAVALTAGFRTVGRRLKFPSDVPEQPALFARYLKDIFPTRATGVLPKTIIEAELWIYSGAGGDPDAVPEDALLALIDAVELGLQPSPATGVQTLGGVVVHCWIEGDLDLSPGDLGGQAMAIIPIKMLAP